MWQLVDFIIVFLALAAALPYRPGSINNVRKVQAMSKAAVFEALMSTIDTSARKLPRSLAERVDSFQFALHPNFLNSSMLNPLQAIALATVDETTGCSPDKRQLSRITGLADANFMGEDSDLNHLTDEQVLTALGRLTLAMLAAWRNQIREHLMDHGHDGYENAVAAPEDFLMLRADRRECMA